MKVMGLNFKDNLMNILTIIIRDNNKVNNIKKMMIKGNI